MIKVKTLILVVVTTFGLLLLTIAVQTIQSGQIAFNNQIIPKDPPQRFNLDSLCNGVKLFSSAKREACAHINKSQKRIHTEADFLFALTNYVSESVKVASGQTELAPDNYWKSSASENLSAMAADQYGVYCGGTAWILLEIFEEFGFDAFTFNFGSRSDSPTSHVVTLVRVNSSIFAYDAYLNLTYTQQDGKPLDFRDLIQFVYQKEFYKINTLSMPISRFILTEKSSDWKSDLQSSWLINSSELEASNFSQCSINQKNVSCPTYNINYEIPFKKLAEGIRINEFLRENNLEENVLNLFLFPKGMSSLKTGYLDLSTIDTDLARKVSQVFFGI